MTTIIGHTAKADIPIPGEAPRFTPTTLIAAMNQTLEYAYEGTLLVGEVASYKVNQGKWVFFDLKDEESSISCFMSIYQLRVPLEDGMKIVVRGVPKITKWGKFSFTVSAIKPVGDGSIKKAFELLKKKLEGEGLFAPEKKRELPKDLTKLGVISSTGAAGYADFVKILNARWGGIHVQVAHTQVQGMDAPDQIIRALKYFNERSEVQVIAILRGGGSADDLSCFNDEELVRTIAASKIPVITGIGHEVDESLADLAADVRASTPSNAAEMLTPDRESIKINVEISISQVESIIYNRINDVLDKIDKPFENIRKTIKQKIDFYGHLLLQKVNILEALNPEKVLKQGYAILSGKVSPGSVVNITTFDKEIMAEVKEIHERKNVTK
ncbi:exodeoxyribonuclease VII large subunit [Candidatus Saccharibacteria bacterium]|nr:exodeoxyribonuclease VII large subunit [Candidatus Saccharibacteria bacterium]